MVVRLNSIPTPSYTSSAPSNAPGTANVSSTGGVTSSPSAQTYTPNSPSRSFSQLSQAKKQEAREEAQMIKDFDDVTDYYNKEIKAYENQKAKFTEQYNNEEISETRYKNICRRIDEYIEESKSWRDGNITNQNKRKANFQNKWGFPYTDVR